MRLNDTCCVSDVENGVQSGTIRASEYTKQWSTLSSDCFVPKSEQLHRKMVWGWLFFTFHFIVTMQAVRYHKEQQIRAVIKVVNAAK